MERIKSQLKDEQHDVIIVKKIYRTTQNDCLPIMFGIEVDYNCISNISEQSAKYIYEELGKLLNLQEGGAE
jgi:fumarate hydratase class II